MDFQTLCQKRRSYRKYTSEKLTHEQLDYIVSCALMSPSAKRFNPWEFVVIEDRDVLKQFHACKTYGSGMFETAQAAVVVALDASLTDTWQADGAIAAQNMMLAATDLGLGSCWCHVYEREDSEQLIRRLTGIPENLHILCVISLGHKGEERKDFDLEKLNRNKVHWGQF